MKQMSFNEKLMIAINCLYALANAMSAVFMNVYLYAYTGSLVVMSIYTMIRIGLFPFFFTIGGKWAQRHRFSHTLTAGLLLIMGQLVFVLFCNDMFAQMSWLVYVAALLFGSGGGLFWLSVNGLNQLVSSSETRSLYLSNIGICNNISSIIAPLISTFIIDQFASDFDGYVRIFQVVLVVYGFISLLSLKLTASSSRQSFSVLKCLRFNHDPQWKYCLISTLLYGMRDSLVLTLSGLLVYNATGGSGSIYGKLLAFFAVLTIISFRVVAVMMKRNNRMTFYRLGSLLLASSTIVLVLVPNLFGAIYFGIVNAISTPMYQNPWQIITMNAIQDYAKEENVIGRVIAKETYQSLGRCLGMACIVLCYLILPENLYLIVSVIFCSSFPVIVTTYATFYHRHRDALKAQGKIQ